MNIEVLEKKLEKRGFEKEIFSDCVTYEKIFDQSNIKKDVWERLNNYYDNFQGIVVTAKFNSWLDLYSFNEVYVQDNDKDNFIRMTSAFVDGEEVFQEELEFWINF